MDPTKTTYAAITDYNFRTSQGTPVTDEQDAVQKTLAAHGISFQIYEVASVNVGGKELKGDPENFTPRCWVGIDRLYTRDEVIKSMEDDMARADQFMKGAIKSVIGEYKKMSPDSVHITGLERQGEFIEIGKDQKVFDRTGQQIWPKAGPTVAVANTFTTMKKIHLKP
jgi:hypothetical protein